MAINEICVIRMGGLGDLTILSSSLRALKAKMLWRPLVLATFPTNVPVLQGAEYLDRVIPIEEAEQQEWFRVYDCRWAVEPPVIGPGKSTWEKYTGQDRSDIFDEILGVSNCHPKNFSVPVNRALLPELKFPTRPAIGLAPTSRTPLRCYPPDYVASLTELLWAMGTPVLFGKTEPWCQQLAHLQMPGIINLIDKLTVPEMITLVSKLDVVISPDTGVYHIAAALDVKCLAVFGNIRPFTRCTYYPTVIPLFPSEEEGKKLCHPFPCWDAPTPGCQRPPGTFGGPCMRLFTPERIVEALKGIL
jgi:ADP-heptose:LPS heptosyltransferase